MAGQLTDIRRAFSLLMAGQLTGVSTSSVTSRPSESASNALSKLKARRTGCSALVTYIELVVKSNALVNQRDDLSQLPTREPPAPVSGNAFVYILACSDRAVYVGTAGDVAKRLAEHRGPKGAKFTRDHPGGRLIYVEGPLSNTLALQREHQLKRWSRAKKLALIRNQTMALKKLSRSREKPRD
jgi:putative endonuclease